MNTAAKNRLKYFPLAVAAALAAAPATPARADYYVYPSLVVGADAVIGNGYLAGTPGRVGYGTGMAATHDVVSEWQFDLSGVADGAALRFVGHAADFSHVLGTTYNNRTDITVGVVPVAAVGGTPQAVWAAVRSGTPMGSFTVGNGLPDFFGTPGPGGDFSFDLGASHGPTLGLGCLVLARSGAGALSVQAELTEARVLVSSVPESASAVLIGIGGVLAALARRRL